MHTDAIRVVLIVVNGDEVMESTIDTMDHLIRVLILLSRLIQITLQKNENSYNTLINIPEINDIVLIVQIDGHLHRVKNNDTIEVQEGAISLSYSTNYTNAIFPILIIG